MEPIYVQDSDEEEIYEEINDDVKQLVKIFQNNRQFGIPIKSFISKLTPEFNELSDYIANLIKKLSYEEEKVAWECIKNQLFLDINQYDMQRSRNYSIVAIKTMALYVEFTSKNPIYVNVKHISQSLILWSNYVCMTLRIIFQKCVNNILLVLTCVTNPTKNRFMLFLLFERVISDSLIKGVIDEKAPTDKEFQVILYLFIQRFRVVVGSGDQQRLDKLERDLLPEHLLKNNIELQNIKFLAPKNFSEAVNEYFRIYAYNSDNTKPSTKFSFTDIQRVINDIRLSTCDIIDIGNLKEPDFTLQSTYSTEAVTSRSHNDCIEDIPKKLPNFISNGLEPVLENQLCNMEIIKDNDKDKENDNKSNKNSSEKDFNCIEKSTKKDTVLEAIDIKCECSTIRSTTNNNPKTVECKFVRRIGKKKIKMTKNNSCKKLRERRPFNDEFFNRISSRKLSKIPHNRTHSSKLPLLDNICEVSSTTSEIILSESTENKIECTQDSINSNESKSDDVSSTYNPLIEEPVTSNSQLNIVEKEDSYITKTNSNKVTNKYQIENLEEISEDESGMKEVSSIPSATLIPKLVVPNSLPLTQIIIDNNDTATNLLSSTNIIVKNDECGDIEKTAIESTIEFERCIIPAHIENDVGASQSISNSSEVMEEKQTNEEILTDVSKKLLSTDNISCSIKQDQLNVSDEPRNESFAESLQPSIEPTFTDINTKVNVNDNPFAGITNSTNNPISDQDNVVVNEVTKLPEPTEQNNKVVNYEICLGEDKEDSQTDTNLSVNEDEGDENPFSPYVSSIDSESDDNSNNNFINNDHKTTNVPLETSLNTSKSKLPSISHILVNKTQNIIETGNNTINDLQLSYANDQIDLPNENVVDLYVNTDISVHQEEQILLQENLINQFKNQSNTNEDVIDTSVKNNTDSNNEMTNIQINDSQYFLNKSEENIQKNVIEDNSLSTTYKQLAELDYSPPPIENVLTTSNPSITVNHNNNKSATTIVDCPTNGFKSFDSNINSGNEQHTDDTSLKISTCFADIFENGYMLSFDDPIFQNDNPIPTLTSIIEKSNKFCNNQKSTTQAVDKTMGSILPPSTTVTLPTAIKPLSETVGMDKEVDYSESRASTSKKSSYKESIRKHRTKSEDDFMLRKRTRPMKIPTTSKPSEKVSSKKIPKESHQYEFVTNLSDNVTDKPKNNDSNNINLNSSKHANANDKSTGEPASKRERISTDIKAKLKDFYEGFTTPEVVTANVTKMHSVDLSHSINFVPSSNLNMREKPSQNFRHYSMAKSNIQKPIRNDLPVRTIQPFDPSNTPDLNTYLECLRKESSGIK